MPSIQYAFIEFGVCNTQFDFYRIGVCNTVETLKHDRQDPQNVIVF